MAKAILFVGIPGSGKSTFYKEKLGELYVHISLDILHKRTKEMALLKECIAQRKNFVIDNTNPTRKDRMMYIAMAKEAGYCTVGYYFRSAIGECLDRNSKRSGQAIVPFKALAHIHKILEVPSYDEGFDELFYVKIEETGFSVSEWRSEGEI